jgi:Protein of unknown function (DUF2783)
MKTALNLQDADGFYELWLDAHVGLSLEDSFELNSRLVLLLANQIGDSSVISTCIAAAKKLERSGENI